MLQRVKPLLSPADTQRARLVCMDWAAELAASVQSVFLPPELWQMPCTDQRAHIRRLISTYSAFQHATLTADRGQHIDLHSLLDAVTQLSRAPTFRSVTVHKLGAGTSCWNSVLTALVLISNKLCALSLTDVKLPGPEGLDAFVFWRLTNIQHLVLISNCSNKLHQQHITMISSIQQLQSLCLSFRTVDGSLHEPLLLDSLGQLTNLKHLEVRYTGEQ